MNSRIVAILGAALIVSACSRVDPASSTTTTTTSATTTPPTTLSPSTNPPSPHTMDDDGDGGHGMMPGMPMHHDGGTMPPGHMGGMGGHP